MRVQRRRVLARGVFWLLAALVAVTACAHAPPCPPEIDMQDSARLEPALVRFAREHPDSSVGVLLRLTGPGDESMRSELERAGLSVGTIAGDIVTGRLRACDAARVAGIERVRYIQLAREIPRPRPMPGSPDP